VQGARLSPSVVGTRIMSWPISLEGFAASVQGMETTPDSLPASMSWKAFQFGRPVLPLTPSRLVDVLHRRRVSEPKT
jgi:hypothetical protein